MVICQEAELKKKYSRELLSESELNATEDLIRLLQPFKELTILISASDYVTSSIVLPAITRLMECMQMFESNHGLFFIQNLAVRMHDNLVDRTRPYFKNNLLLAATFLDPRYRSLMFIKDQNDRDRALFEASSYVKGIYRNKCSKKLKPTETSIDAVLAPKKSKVHLNFTLLCPEEIIDDEEDDADIQNEVIINELKRFRKFRVVTTDSSCPLSFYKSNEFIFPNLSKIAELVFCTTASSVPSECTFSAAGELINKKRTRLYPALAEDLLFLNRNYMI